MSEFTLSTPSEVTLPARTRGSASREPNPFIENGWYLANLDENTGKAPAERVGRENVVPKTMVLRVIRWLREAGDEFQGGVRILVLHRNKNGELRFDPTKLGKKNTDPNWAKLPPNTNMVVAWEAKDRKQFNKTVPTQ